ncbi:hypothetical protein [Arthrobacter alkaliphilus]
MVFGRQIDSAAHIGETLGRGSDDTIWAQTAKEVAWLRNVVEFRFNV